MQALAAQDNLAEALGVYGQLSDCLRDQLGVSPSPATRRSTSSSSPQPERRRNPRGAARATTSQIPPDCAALEREILRSWPRIKG